jgi:hypothetical protein
VDSLARAERQFARWWERLFAPQLQLEEIKREIEHAVDDAYDRESGLIPGAYTVTLGGEDYLRYRQVLPLIRAESERHIQNYALRRRYTVAADVYVTMERDDAIGRRGPLVAANPTGAARPRNAQPRTLGRLLPIDPGPAGPYLIESESVVIGRGEDCAVWIDDLEVSRHHARLDRQRDGWYVTAEKTTNRTKLNGRTLEPGSPEHLVSGDVLRLGGVELVWREE